MNSIHESVVLPESVSLGAFIVICEGVKIGSDCVIGNHVVIHEGSVIGNQVRIDDHAVIGKQPMKALTSATSSAEKQVPCHIGDGCILGTHTIIYANCTIGNHCLVADYASIRENVTVGEKNIIGRNATIENWCTIGNACKIETNAYITAYSTLEDYIFVAPGVVTSNDNYVGRDPDRFNHFKGVTLKKGARLGAQVTVLPGKIIGEETFVAAGSLVTKDLEPRKVYMGSPAKMIKDVDIKQRL
jgi:UDP-2-acetamido-3-amino-2,3-dideoxy-glucuronate N-acetyltransferase